MNGLAAGRTLRGPGKKGLDRGRRAPPAPALQGGVCEAERPAKGVVPPAGERPVSLAVGVLRRDLPRPSPERNGKRRRRPPPQCAPCRAPPGLKERRRSGSPARLLLRAGGLEKPFSLLPGPAATCRGRKPGSSPDWAAVGRGSRLLARGAAALSVRHSEPGGGGREMNCAWCVLIEQHGAELLVSRHA